MAAKDIVYEMQQQIAEVFESQNPELLDTVFEIEEKKIYGDKFRLSLFSSTFNSMLSDRWISKNDAIKIETYKFDDFKEFLKFLYSGKCQLSDENILTMTDIAEFYQVNSFKKYCGEYLSKITLNMENIFQLIETSRKYSITQMKKSIQDFISLNFTTFVKCEKFLKADKSIVEEIFTIKSNTAFKQEELFQAVYEWAEYQANIKNEFNDENPNKNDAIKNEMKEFLPLIEFKKMELSFLKNYVVKRGFLFTYDELSDILINANSVTTNIFVENSGTAVKSSNSDHSYFVAFCYVMIIFFIIFGMPFCVIFFFIILKFKQLS